MEHLQVDHTYWLEKAIRMAVENVERGEGPFAAIVVRGREIVGTGVNRVSADSDPTSHAELRAISEACRRLQRTDLSDCILYASGEPCPMCMGAIYWAKPQAVYFACSKAEASQAVGFGDPLQGFYAEMTRSAESRTIPVRHLDAPGKLEPFQRFAERAE
jgi:guanine deaminase